MLRIMNNNMPGFITKMAGNLVALPRGRNAGIYTQSIHLGLNTQYVSGGAEVTPRRRSSEPGCASVPGPG